MYFRSISFQVFPYHYHLRPEGLNLWSRLWNSFLDDLFVSTLPLFNSFTTFRRMIFWKTKSCCICLWCLPIDLSVNSQHLYMACKVVCNLFLPFSPALSSTTLSTMLYPYYLFFPFFLFHCQVWTSFSTSLCSLNVCLCELQVLAYVSFLQIDTFGFLICHSHGTFSSITTLVTIYSYVFVLLFASLINL